MQRILIVIFALGFLPAVAAAQTESSNTQTAAADTAKAAAQGTVKAGTPAKPAEASRPAKPDSSVAKEEMELEAIAIEAIIEKPNVDIIPKRVTPDLEEVEFVERSFDRELKAVPKDLLLLDDDLDRVAKLEELKKLLEKKKKK
jgi:hypothetical protein